MAVLIQYFFGENDGYIFIYKREYDQPKCIQFPKQAIQKEVLDFLGKMQDEPIPEGSLKAIVQPIIENTSENELLWIVPHQVLHYLPFHAIKTSEGYLGFRNPICYTPSATSINTCRLAPRIDGKGVLTVGNPTEDLPYARREAEEISRLYNGEFLLGRDATKQNFFAKLEQQESLDIVHFACHGTANPKDSLKSGVLLSKSTEIGSVEGDLLSADEILYRNIFAGLVTVSACDAGLGTFDDSDEVLGLTRSLLASGSASVLLSNWPVNDLSTYLLTQKFYEELRKHSESGTGNKAVAIQTAQKYLHEINLGDLIQICEKKSKESLQNKSFTEALNFSLDAANWASFANDYEQAIAHLQTAHQIMDQSEELKNYDESLYQKKMDFEYMKMFANDSINPKHRPFEDEVFWSAFFLHGDWKI